MPTFTPKLGIKKPLGNETVSRAAFNENWDIIDQMAAREPFLLKSAVYDSSNDRIDITIGPGRADFLGMLVVKETDTVYSINTPAPGTNYFLYLKSDGTFTHNTTSGGISGAVPLWRVSTGATVDAISVQDLRGELSGTAARLVKEQLAAHTAATTGVHGATSAATPNTIVQRDPDGRFKAAAPSDPEDVARKAEVDAHIAALVSDPGGVHGLQVETGIWTPELRFGGSTAGITYVFRMGLYTRIANVVYWAFAIELSSKGSASGSAMITGLPFNKGAGLNFYHAVGRTINISVPSGQWLSSHIAGTTVYLTTNTGSFISSTEFSDYSVIGASGFYFI